MDTTAIKQKLLNLGLMYDKFSGIQIDVDGAFRTTPAGVVEASLCDHNCVSPYQCPAAKSINKGIDPRSMAPADWIVQKVQHGAAGLKVRREYDLAGLDEHCARFQIPTDVQAAMHEILLEGNIEVNLFGGNPELHPDIIEIIRLVKGLGHRVNLTTTGRRLMRDEKFVAAFLETPPHVLAVSAGECTVEELERLIGLSLDELQTTWRRDVSTDDGPHQKMVEATFVAKWSRDIKNFPLLLFNMVVDRVNIMSAARTIARLEQEFPHAIVNPYPNQEGFHYGENFFSETELDEFGKLVDWAIERTIAGGRFVKRLHFWLLMKATFNTWLRSPEKIALSVAGYGIWRCYKPGSGRYLQIGRSPLVAPPEQEHPGGHLGCFWNDHTVTQHSQIQDAAEVSHYLVQGATVLSQEASKPCPGCAMPRLMFDLMNIQAGMDEELIPEFLKLRLEYAGF